MKKRFPRVAHAPCLLALPMVLGLASGASAVTASTWPATTTILPSTSTTWQPPTTTILPNTTTSRPPTTTILPSTSTTVPTTTSTSATCPVTTTTLTPPVAPPPSPQCESDPAAYARAGFPEVDAGGGCSTGSCPTMEDFCAGTDTDAAGNPIHRGGVGVTACTPSMPCDGSIPYVHGTPAPCPCPSSAATTEPVTCEAQPVALGCDPADPLGSPLCPYFGQSSGVYTSLLAANATQVVCDGDGAAQPPGGGQGPPPTLPPPYPRLDCGNVCMTRPLDSIDPIANLLPGPGCTIRVRHCTVRSGETKRCGLWLPPPPLPGVGVEVKTDPDGSKKICYTPLPGFGQPGVENCFKMTPWPPGKEKPGCIHFDIVPWNRPGYLCGCVGYDGRIGGGVTQDAGDKPWFDLVIDPGPPVRIQIPTKGVDLTTGNGQFAEWEITCPNAPPPAP